MMMGAMTTPGTTTVTTPATTTEPRGPRPRRRSGFRLRVFGLLAALLVGAVGAGLVIERSVLLARVDREVEAAHEQERTELEVLARGNDPRTGRPFGGDVEAVLTTFLDRNLPSANEVMVAFVDGAELRATASPVPFADLPDLTRRWAAIEDGTRGTSATQAGPLRWLAVPIEGADGTVAGVFVVGTFTADARDEVEETLRVEALVSALVLLVALAVAWVVAGRLLRPVRDVTANARSLTDTDLSARIPVRGDDEVAELARTYNAMLDRLQLAFETQRRFVDDAGHELRTPITIIRGHLELMGDDPDETRETIALVTDELDRMARMVGDLLELAKADQPDFLRPGPVDLGDLTDGLLGRCRTLGDRTWRVDGRAAGTVVADEQRLTQALLNLARNAVEHTRPGDEVAIGTAIVGDEAHLWVRDTGSGVPAEERDRLFERFSRGSSRRRSADGAGLGLAIVKAIADAHGGRVGVDDAPGGGAVFVVVVPGVLPVTAAGPDDPTRTSPLEEPAWPAS
jgi:signal transduction histidine kinase